MSSNIMTLDPSKTLFGPNLVVLPTDNIALFESKERHFLVPSQWVKDLYCQQVFVTPTNIHIWPVGIDTNKWKPGTTSTPTQDCFIYFKNRSKEDLKVVRLLLNKLGLNYTVIEYGSYTEQQLFDTCSASRFAVLLTGTESQGIAYMEILSMNTPCYVFNKPTWSSEDNGITCPATSVPYFNESCGIVSPQNNVSLEHFKTFLNSVEDTQFQPRMFIEQRHSLILAASNLLQIAKIL